MRHRFFILFLLLGLSSLTFRAVSQPSERGVLYPEQFGAKANGLHDDTRAIQFAIDSLVKIGGGTVQFGSGTYLVSSVSLGPKVSLVGNGNGATIIKQAKGQKNHCLIVRDIAAALKIADLTILGEKVNRGIFFEQSGGFGENQHYLYSNTSNWDKSQAYKWITIDNVCVYKFETGLFIRERGFNVNISNSTFSYNGNGVIMSCSDCSLYNCYVANNNKNGLVLNGGANKISNIKSIFNGSANAKLYGAIVVKATGCQFVNCEVQDNYGKGFIIEGKYNLFSNCMSNTNGYTKSPFHYDPEVKACGFMISGLYNTFSNCVVMNYNEKYGAVYHSPVIVDDAVSYYYPDIFSDIKVLNADGRLMFNEPFKNVQSLCSKNQVDNLNIVSIDGAKYFSKNRPDANILKAYAFHTSSLQMLVDFNSSGNGGKLIEINGDKSISVEVEKSSVSLYWQGIKKSELVLDEDAVMNKDDLRMIVSFSQYEDKMYVKLLMFEKTTGRGWIKKTIRKETDIPSGRIKNAIVSIGDSDVPVKRIVVSQSPLPESVSMPSSNLNKVYDAAIVYVDADTM